MIFFYIHIVPPLDNGLWNPCMNLREAPNSNVLPLFQFTQVFLYLLTFKSISTENVPWTKWNKEGGFSSRTRMCKQWPVSAPTDQDLCPAAVFFHIVSGALCKALLVLLFLFIKNKTHGLISKIKTWDDHKRPRKTTTTTTKSTTARFPIHKDPLNLLGAARLSRAFFLLWSPPTTPWSIPARCMISLPLKPSALFSWTSDHNINNIPPTGMYKRQTAISSPHSGMKDGGKTVCSDHRKELIDWKRSSIGRVAVARPSHPGLWSQELGKLMQEESKSQACPGCRGALRPACRNDWNPASETKRREWGCIAHWWSAGRRA